MHSMSLIFVFPFLTLGRGAAILNARQSVTPPTECNVIPTWEITSFNWFNSSDNLDCVTQANARKSFGQRFILSDGKARVLTPAPQHRKASASSRTPRPESYSPATETSSPAASAASAPASRASRCSQPASGPLTQSPSAQTSPVTCRASRPTRRASGAPRSGAAPCSAAASRTASILSGTAAPT